jgi:hypothetical protein
MNSFSTVFARKAYVALALAVAAGLWVLMMYLDQLLFFTPVFAFYIPADAWTSFSLSTTVSALLGTVVSMNVYVFRTSKVRLGGSFLSGSTLGVISGVCAGCTSAGFFLVTTFGVAGIAATSILAQYQLPLRLASIGLLMWAYYSAHRRITQSCAVNLNANDEQNAK